MSNKSERPKSSQEKWRNEINVELDQNIAWEVHVAYEMAFKCTKSSKLRVCNFKILHRRLATNTFLKRMGLVNDEICISCQSERESLFHLFWEICTKTELFWNSIFSWLQSCKIISKEVNLQVDVALGLRPDNLKYFIWLSKLKERIPRLDEFLPFVKLTYQIEKIDPQSKDCNILCFISVKHIVLHVAGWITEAIIMKQYIWL